MGLILGKLSYLTKKNKKFALQQHRKGVVRFNKPYWPYLVPLDVCDYWENYFILNLGKLFFKVWLKIVF